MRPPTGHRPRASLVGRCSPVSSSPGPVSGSVLFRSAMGGAGPASSPPRFFCDGSAAKTSSSKPLFVHHFLLPTSPWWFVHTGTEWTPSRLAGPFLLATVKLLLTPSPITDPLPARAASGTCGESLVLPRRKSRGPWHESPQCLASWSPDRMPSPSTSLVWTGHLEKVHARQSTRRLTQAIASVKSRGRASRSVVLTLTRGARLCLVASASPRTSHGGLWTMDEEHTKTPKQDQCHLHVSHPPPSPNPMVALRSFAPAMTITEYAQAAPSVHL